MSKIRALSRALLALGVLATPAAIVSCHDAPSELLPRPGLDAELRDLSNKPSKAERDAGQSIAHALALALNEAESRTALFDALASAEGKEHKLHFSSFMKGSAHKIAETADRRTGSLRVRLLRNCRRFERWSSICPSLDTAQNGPQSNSPL